MLEQLLSSVKEQLGGELKQKEQLSDHQINQTMDASKEAMSEAVKSQASSGGLNQITSLFNGQKEHAPTLIETVMRFLIPKLVTKLNIPESKAHSIANMVVPFLVNKFSSKDTGTASDSSDLLGKFTGGSGGLGGSLKGLFG